jgi:hypothetical protein
VCVCVYTHTYRVHRYTHTYIGLKGFVCIRVCIHTHTHTHTQTHRCIRTYINTGFKNVINLVIDNYAQWFVVVPGAVNLVQVIKKIKNKKMEIINNVPRVMNVPFTL